MRKFCLLLLPLFILISPGHVFAKPVCVEIIPQKIHPGDAFLIKVKNFKGKKIPSASLGEKEFAFTECGKDCYLSIGAIDFKARPKSYFVKVEAGNKKFKKRLSVKKQRLPVLKLTLPDEKVSPVADDLERIEAENKKLKDIWQTITEKQWDGNFILPLENETSTAFGVKRIMNGKWTSIHRGMDIRGKDGEPVKAANNGKVVLAEELFYGGNTLVLDHGNGIFTVYMHLSSFRASAGDTVAKSDTIGFVGSSGRSTGPHLHFGLKVMDTNVNPVSLIKLGL